MTDSRTSEGKYRPLAHPGLMSTNTRSTTLEDHFRILEGCVVNPDRAVETLRNIQAKLEPVKDLR